MITDLRTRIWSNLDQFGPEVASNLRNRYADKWDQLDGSPAVHEREMACTNCACVFGFRSDLLEASVPNELVAEFVSRDPQRRIGVAGIDPISSGALFELEKAIDMGLSAVSISPAAQGFHPAHSAAMRIYERCAVLGLPVFISNDVPLTKSSILEFAHPASFDEVARSIPELKLVIGELGYPWINEGIALIGKHPNVYADTAGIVARSWELYNVLLTAASCGVMNKILFGSGFPFTTPTQAIESLYSVNSHSHGTQLPSVSRSLTRSIVERDSLAVLGIDHNVPQQDHLLPASDDENIEEPVTSITEIKPEEVPTEGLNTD